MARIVRNFLTSGFAFGANEQLLGFRFAFFNAAMALIALVLFLFSLYRFSINNVVVGVIDLAYSVLLMLSIWMLRKDKTKYDRTAQFVITLTFVALVAATLAAREGNILSWYILYVIMAFIMGGWRTGLSAYVASSITLLLFSTYLPDIYAPKTAITLISINTIITFMTFHYDRRVHLDHVRLEKINARLLHREHETLRMLGKLAEYKDPETGTHIARVSEYSSLLAQASGLDDEMVDIIYYATPFHDIGKVGIADSIMLKEGKLNDEEFDIIKTHTRIGSEILRNADSKYLRAGAIIADTHHERWDGGGYPNGLKGEAIPILGRIVAVADVFDALTTERPYKKAWSFDEAMAYISSEAGKHFDPKLVELFRQHEQSIYQIYRAYVEEV